MIYDDFSGSMFAPGFSLPADMQAYDYHVHTRHSYCARHEAMTIPNIVARCEQLEYRRLGISDHPYVESGVVPLLENGRAIEQLQTPIEVYLGVELDFTEPGKPLIAVEDVDFTDYRFAAINHNMARRYPDVGTVEGVAAAVEMWFEHMEGVLDFDVDGVVHPFSPLERHLEGRAVFDSVDPQRFGKLFQAFAAKGIALELRSDLDYFPTAAGSLRRFYRMALDAGVKLSCATDSHWLDRLGFQLLQARVAYDIGLKAEQLWHPKGPPRNRPTSS